MRLLRVVLCLAVIQSLLAPLQAQQEDAPAYFSVTSERTYQPGEKIEIGVYSNNVVALGFRVYRVNDAAKFFSQLQDMHSFGGQAPRMPKQQKGWLERFHAWKHRIWAWIRDFIRAQFSPDARHQIRLWRMGETEASKRGTQATEFAQVPVLNQQQLVTEWKWSVPKGERWQSQRVEIPVRNKGVYLVEATNGTLRAYTIIVVTEIAIITKAAPGRLLCYVVDRNSGDPIAGAATRVWMEQQEIADKPTDQHGI
ncbi:MAG TPA: alpha-2-macroglobulin, partial [Candidatus Methylomirabilis sp.]|nr:alpha-2-macroglobulin [Candidatus Methylomirabilis sp.]